MDIQKTATNTAVNFVGAAFLTALAAYGSKYTTKMPSLNMNAALASAVLSTTGALVGSGLHGLARKDAGNVEKMAAVAFFALAFNGLSQVAPLTDKVSFLSMSRNEAAILGVASTVGILGATALKSSYDNRVVKTPYESGVAGIEAAAKAVTDARDAVEGTKKAHEADTADKELKTAYDAAEKTLKESTEAFKGLVTKHTWKDDAEGAKYKELNDTLFPAAPKKGD